MSFETSEIKEQEPESKPERGSESIKNTESMFAELVVAAEGDNAAREKIAALKVQSQKIIEDSIEKSVKYSINTVIFGHEKEEGVIDNQVNDMADLSPSEKIEELFVDFEAKMGEDSLVAKKAMEIKDAVIVDLTAALETERKKRIEDFWSKALKPIPDHRAEHLQNLD